MIKIIATVNQKGGVGKTTTCVNLAYGLAKNYNVTLGDLDPNGHATLIYLDNESIESHNNYINEVFINRKDVIPFPAIDKKSGLYIEKLNIIPSNIKLAVIAEQLSSKVHKEKMLFNYLKKFEDTIIILDCPPNLGLLAINGIYAADLIIIPTTYGRYSLEGMADLLGTIEEIKETNDFNYKILRNNYDSRNSQTNKFVESQLDMFRENVLNTRIRKCESINQAQINEECIYTFDDKSNGKIDFEALSNEIMEQLNEQI